MSLVVLVCSVDRVIRCRDQLDFTDRALVDEAAVMAGNRERQAVGLYGAFCKVKDCSHRRQASFWRCICMQCCGGGDDDDDGDDSIVTKCRKVGKWGCTWQGKYTHTGTNLHALHSLHPFCPSLPPSFLCIPHPHPHSYPRRYYKTLRERPASWIRPRLR